METSTLNATFNLTESDLREVEINVKSRLTNLEFHLGVCELEPKDCWPVMKFYGKVLRHRQKRFDQIKSARNFSFLNKALYARCVLNSRINGMPCREERHGRFPEFYNYE